MISYSSLARFILATCLLLLNPGCNGFWKQPPPDTLANDAIGMAQQAPLGTVELTLPNSAPEQAMIRVVQAYPFTEK
jgi:hypothetical protein